MLDLRPVENHLVIDDMQKGSSTYTKDSNHVTFIRNSEALYVDKEKSTKLLRTIGFQMPIELQRSRFIGSISYKGQNVNISGTEFSEIISQSNEQYQQRTTTLTDREALSADGIDKDKAKEQSRAYLNKDDDSYPTHGVGH